MSAAVGSKADSMMELLDSLCDTRNRALHVARGFGLHNVLAEVRLPKTRMMLLGLVEETKSESVWDRMKQKKELEAKSGEAIALGRDRAPRLILHQFIPAAVEALASGEVSPSRRGKGARN